MNTIHFGAKPGLQPKLSPSPAGSTLSEPEQVSGVKPESFFPPSQLEGIAKAAKQRQENKPRHRLRLLPGFKPGGKVGVLLGLATIIGLPLTGINISAHAFSEASKREEAVAPLIASRNRIEASYKENVEYAQKFTVDEAVTLADHIKPKEHLEQLLKDVHQAMLSHSTDEAMQAVLQKYRPDLSEKDQKYALYLIGMAREAYDPINKASTIYDTWSREVLSKQMDPEALRQHREASKALIENIRRADVAPMGMKLLGIFSILVTIIFTVGAIGIMGDLCKGKTLNDWIKREPVPTDPIHEYAKEVTREILNKSEGPPK